jgi:prevent-host-death family protein
LTRATRVSRRAPREGAQDREKAKKQAVKFQVRNSRLDASQVRSEWAQTIDQVAHKGDRVVVMRHGKPAAAIVSAEDLALLEALEDRVDLEDARAALARVKRQGTIPWKTIKAALGL